MRAVRLSGGGAGDIYRWIDMNDSHGVTHPGLSSVPGKDTVNIHRWEGGLKPVTAAFSKEVETPGPPWRRTECGVLKALQDGLQGEAGELPPDPGSWRRLCIRH